MHKVTKLRTFFLTNVVGLTDAQSLLMHKVTKLRTFLTNGQAKFRSLQINLTGTLPEPYVWNAK